MPLPLLLGLAAADGEIELVTVPLTDGIIMLDAVLDAVEVAE